MVRVQRYYGSEEIVSKIATIETAGTVGPVYAASLSGSQYTAGLPWIVPMDIETTFDMLSSSVRRTIIAVLHETDSIERSQLAATLAVLEADEGDEDAVTETRRRLRVALHHNHLPRLADGNLITYDDETVSATAELDEIAQTAPLPDVDGQIAATSA